MAIEQPQEQGWGLLGQQSLPRERLPKKNAFPSCFARSELKKSFLGMLRTWETIFSFCAQACKSSPERLPALVPQPANGSVWVFLGHLKKGGQI